LAGGEDGFGPPGPSWTTENPSLAVSSWKEMADRKPPHIFKTWMITSLPGGARNASGTLFAPRVLCGCGFRGPATDSMAAPTSPKQPQRRRSSNGHKTGVRRFPIPIPPTRAQKGMRMGTAGPGAAHFRHPAAPPVGHGQVSPLGPPTRSRPRLIAACPPPPPSAHRLPRRTPDWCLRGCDPNPPDGLFLRSPRTRCAVPHSRVREHLVLDVPPPAPGLRSRRLPCGPPKRQREKGGQRSRNPLDREGNIYPSMARPKGIWEG